jgi:hypothetical protein
MRSADLARSDRLGVTSSPPSRTGRKHRRLHRAQFLNNRLASRARSLIGLGGLEQALAQNFPAPHLVLVAQERVRLPLVVTLVLGQERDVAGDGSIAWTDQTAQMLSHLHGEARRHIWHFPLDLLGEPDPSRLGHGAVDVVPPVVGENARPPAHSGSVRTHSRQQSLTCFLAQPTSLSALRDASGSANRRYGSECRADDSAHYKVHRVHVHSLSLVADMRSAS